MLSQSETTLRYAFALRSKSKSRLSVVEIEKVVKKKMGKIHIFSPQRTQSIY